MMKTYENKKDHVNEECEEEIEEDEDDDRDDDDDLRNSDERAEMMENSFHSILDALSTKVRSI